MSNSWALVPPSDKRRKCSPVGPKGGPGILTLNPAVRSGTLSLDYSSESPPSSIVVCPPSPSTFCPDDHLGSQQGPSRELPSGTCSASLRWRDFGKVFGEGRGWAGAVTEAHLQCEPSSSDSLLLLGNSDDDQIPVIGEHFQQSLGRADRWALRQTLARSAAWDSRSVEKRWAAVTARESLPSEHMGACQQAGWCGAGPAMEQVVEVTSRYTYSAPTECLAPY